jgi:Cdc6-like AAA superfamily ATPase
VFSLFKEKEEREKMNDGMNLDISKAYDRIEWSFVHMVISSMNFPEKLCNTIMKCVPMVSYQILINGKPRKSFTLE